MFFYSGEMRFRLVLPLGHNKKKFRACVDGQMGTVIKTYREWKMSGDDEWLRLHWGSVEKILEYAWSKENADEWDKNKDGVLEGRQHHTLDMELFGASSWLEGFYLAALKAAAKMAEYLGKTEKHDEYIRLFNSGCAWTKKNLFNGKYFIQKIDIKDKNITEHFNCSDMYWNEENSEIKYQIAEGSEIDQLCAQWHADICGLGQIFDQAQVKTALENIYKNNFKESMREIANPWRIFSLNDESGAIICDYPEGVYKPKIPIPYCEETMHGFEYQLAGLLISRGMIEEGIRIVRAIREKYDGKKRNPWNEMECGSNYARSLASFALIPLFSGFVFDLPNRMIGFKPVYKNDFKCIWSVSTGWGSVECGKELIKIYITDGFLYLAKIQLSMNEVSCVKLDGEKIDFIYDGGCICFDDRKIKTCIEIYGAEA